MDDRNLVVRGAAQALAKQAEWMGWCRYLGLYENSGKAAFVAKHLRDQKYLLEHTQPDRVRQQARVLGVDLSRTRRGRHLTLELATKVKERLYVSRCVSVGAWGCWLKTFRDSFGFGSRVKTLLQGHPSASRDLWALLTGHIVDMEFVATLRSFGALARGLKAWQDQGRLLSGGQWFQVLLDRLVDLGFAYQAGSFTHGSVGAFDWPWSARQGRFDRWLASVSHTLREAWRHQCSTQGLRSVSRATLQRSGH